MIGFLSLKKDKADKIDRREIYFVSVPDGLSPSEIKDRFAQLAQTFANTLDSNKVYLNYGKDEFIEYEY